MGLLQTIRCMRGRHYRDHRRAHHHDGTYFSVCVGCEKPMVRDGFTWRLVKPGEASPPE